MFEEKEDKVYFKFLQILYLQNNQKIQELGALKCANLLELNLEGNNITKLEQFEGHAKLEYLNLGNNKIQDLKLIRNCTNLKTLILHSNKIKIFEGLTDLSSLKTLDLANNQIEANGEEFPVLENLETLNISENKIPTYEVLKQFDQIPKLKNFQILGNPCVMDVTDPKVDPVPKANYVFDVMYLLRGLKQLDGKEITLDSWKQAYKYKEKSWWDAHNTKIEADRKAREEQARLEAEQQAKDDQ